MEADTEAGTICTSEDRIEGMLHHWSHWTCSPFLAVGGLTYEGDKSALLGSRMAHHQSWDGIIAGV